MNCKQVTELLNDVHKWLERVDRKAIVENASCEEVGDFMCAAARMFVVQAELMGIANEQCTGKDLVGICRDIAWCDVDHQRASAVLN